MLSELASLRSIGSMFHNSFGAVVGVWLKEIELKRDGEIAVAAVDGRAVALISM